jgi:hypothetical protein
VVERVEGSRLLVASVLAEIIHEAGGGGGSATLRELAAGIADRVWSSARGFGVERLARCLCEDEEALIDEARSWREWAELASEVRSELMTRFGAAALEGAGLEELEAALRGSGSLPTGYGDAQLVYAVHYLSPSASSLPATAARPRRGDAGWLRIALEDKKRDDRLRCRIQDEEEWPKVAVTVLYSYVLPRRPPSCGELEGKLAGAAVEPCRAARLVVVPQPFRVEYAEGTRWRPLLAFTGYSASLAMYGYPPQLLVVDRYSRMTAGEAAVARPLIEEAIRKSQPYLSFVRGWETRSAMG